MAKRKRSADINQPVTVTVTGAGGVSMGGGAGTLPGTITGLTGNTIAGDRHYHQALLPHTALLGIAADDHHNPVTVGNTGLSLSNQQVSLALAAVSGLAISSGLMLDDAIAGAGIAITSKVLGIDLATNSGLELAGSPSKLALKAPSTLSVSSANTVTDALGHTHAIASSSNPNAAASILATDANGYLQLVRLGLGTAPGYPLHVIGAGRIDGDLTFVGAQKIDTTADSLTLAPAADLDLTPGGTARVRATSGVRLQSDNFVSQTTGWAMSYAGGLDARYIYADELHAKSFITDLEQALAGGQIIAKSVAVVAADFAVPAAGAVGTLVVEDLPGAAGQAVFQANDIVRLRQFSRGAGSLTIADCWGVVTGYSDNADGTQSWTFTRSSGARAGTAAGTISAKTLALDYGVSGNGLYEVNAIDGAWAENSPYAQIVTWTTHPYDGKVVRSRWGNLKGIFSVANEFGLYAGDGITDASKFLRISNTAIEGHNLPIKLYDGASVTMALDPTAPSFAMGATLPSAYGTGAGVWMGKDTAYKFRVGDPAAAWFTANGTDIAIQQAAVARIKMTAAGVLTVNDSAGAAVITLDASAGAEITKKLTMPGASSAIAIGATPPTAANAGTGIWIDRTGMYGLLANVLQAKFDATTGAITAGAGNVVLNAAGINLIPGESYATTRAYRIMGGTSFEAVLYGVIQPNDSYLFLDLSANDAGDNAAVTIGSTALSTAKVSSVSLHAWASGGAYPGALLTVTRDGSGNRLLDFNGTAAITGGLNVGTATGAVAGQIRVQGSAAAGITVERTSGQPSIKAGSTDKFMIIDSAGQQLLLNYYVADNVSIAVGGGKVLIGTATDDGVNTVQVNGGGMFVGSVAVGAAQPVQFGTTEVDGRWQIVRVGNDLLVRRRESGSWITKHTFAA